MQEAVAVARGVERVQPPRGELGAVDVGDAEHAAQRVRPPLDGRVDAFALALFERGVEVLRADPAPRSGKIGVDGDRQLPTAAGHAGRHGWQCEE